MIHKKTIWALAAASVLAISAGCSGGGGGAGGGSEILATVEGEPITIDHFNTYLGVKPTVRVLVSGQVAELPVSDTLAFQAMQDLVSRTLLYQMAKDESVMPSDKDVEEEIKFQEKLDPNFMPTYKNRGMTLGQIREEVKFSLVQERLTTKGITVSNDEVDTWVKNNPNAFIIPAKVSMSWILAKTDQKKNQAELELKSGKKFSEVAIALSQAPSAALVNGKYLPERGAIPISNLAANLRPQVEKAGVGSDTEWIKFSEGWAKFHVDAKEDQKKIELTPERKENIRRNIALQRGSKANDLRKRLVDRVRTSEIVVRRDSLKEAWKNFSDLLKKQAEQSTQSQSPTPNQGPATEGAATAGGG